MSDNSPLRRPSDRIEELRDQLLRELNRLDQDGGGEEPELYRAYLQHAQVLAWRGVAEGRMDAPRRIMEALLDAEPFIYLHRAGEPDPLAAAAQEVHSTLRALQLADEALEKRQVEDRLADEERSQTEREILRVLLENRGKYLRRGAIHDRLKPPHKPTPARVGQILAELDAEGLVLHVNGRAQGNPNAAFYALSPRGLAVCRSLDFVEEREDEVEKLAARVVSQRETDPPLIIHQALSLLVDPDVPWDWRSILAGLVANLDPTPVVQFHFQQWHSRFPENPETERLIQEITTTWTQAASDPSSQSLPSKESNDFKEHLISMAVSACRRLKAA